MLNFVVVSSVVCKLMILNFDVLLPVLLLLSLIPFKAAFFNVGLNFIFVFALLKPEHFVYSIAF